MVEKLRTMRINTYIIRWICSFLTNRSQCIRISKVNIRIQPKRRPQGVEAPKRLNTNRLDDGAIKQAPNATLDERLTSTPPKDSDVETYWTSLRELVYSTAMEILGPSAKRHKDWFDDNCNEIRLLLEQKHRAHQASLNDPASVSKKDALPNIRRRVQRKLREMQDSWLSSKAAQI